MEERIQELERDLQRERALNKDLQEATAFTKEAALDSGIRAKQVAAAAAKACSFVENMGEVLVAANLFKDGLQAAKDFAAPTLRKFIRVVTDYQDKMECTLEEMRKINISLIGLTVADRRKGKEAEAPGPSAEYKTPEPRKQAEQREATDRNPEEPGVEEEGGQSAKRPYTTGEGSKSKDTPDPIAKRTGAGTNNPEGSAASPAGAEKSSQQSSAGCHDESEEYDLRRTRGGSASSPLGVSE